jgi:hypothetical protein
MKKMRRPILLGIILAGNVLASLLAAAGPAGFFLASPDHPPAWYVSGRKLDQRLRWRREDETLMADIVYARTSAVDGWHPARYDLFTVRFPSVHLSGQELYFISRDNQKTVLARRANGIFGEQVDLDDGFILTVRRQDGELSAVISSKETSKKGHLSSSK